MIIKLTDKELDWCKDLAMKRSGSMNHADTKNSSNFFKRKPAWWRHYIGVIGEFAYSKHTGEKVDILTIGKGDSGSDFKYGVDVKSSNSKNRPPLLLFANQFKRKVAKHYVLAWVKENSVELIGHIKRKKVIELKEIKDFGFGETYVIDNKHLTKFK